MGSRRVWWAVLIVVVSALAFFGARGRSPEPEGTPREVARATSAPSPEPESELKATSPVAPDEPPKAEPVAVPEQDVPPQVQRFLDANVYPPTSRPLTADATDLLHPNQRYEKPRPLDEDREVTFVFTADRYYYTGDEIAQIWLEVLKGGQPAAVDIKLATARAEERGRPSGACVDLGLRPDGVRWTSDGSRDHRSLRARAARGGVCPRPGRRRPLVHAR